MVTDIFRKEPTLESLCSSVKGKKPMKHTAIEQLLEIVQDREESSEQLFRKSWDSFFVSMDLQDFLLRARVLRLYRQALRISGRAPSSARGELRQTIRQEMENNRKCNDKQRIRFLISEGLERLNRLGEMLDMQGH
ncbi:hypothetical protein ACSQ67_000020 [Phaseolus vulgaris]